MPQLIDQLVRDDAAAPREGLEAVHRLWLPHCVRLGRSQRLTQQLGDDLSHGPFFTLYLFLGCVENVVRDIAGGAC